MGGRPSLEVRQASWAGSGLSPSGTVRPVLRCAGSGYERYLYVGLHPRKTCQGLAGPPRMARYSRRCGPRALDRSCDECGGTGATSLLWLRGSPPRAAKGSSPPGAKPGAYFPSAHLCYYSLPDWARGPCRPLPTWPAIDGSHPSGPGRAFQAGLNALLGEPVAPDLATFAQPTMAA
ncbi:hypothetical protein GCM10020219_005020 [Nonomuraea dietziae]